ncbi:MAG: VCBS repeat-containing protein, partial [Chitinophagales bacterium]|nr:VCBS repeat-containing protein [Chitinophagales bacterium]
MKKYLFCIISLFSILSLPAQALKTEADIAGKTINTALEVGVVAGSASVSLGGNATYTIPVYIPEGIHGMQPSVSVSYSSAAGNGMLGYGWNLSAYSVITYVTKNLYNDNEVAPNYIGGASPFLLDGVRLIPVGTNEFRTESESFSKITTNSATSPTSFTVITKSGITIEYGTTTDAKLNNTAGVTVKWYIKKSTDNLGNYIEYEYNTENDEKVLKKIIYTKNAAAASIIPNEIVFTYATRIDNNVSFSIQQSSNTVEPIYKKNKLTSIAVNAEGVAVKKYDFLYGDDGLYSYLNEVKETGYESGGGAKELNSTIFKYGTTATNNSTESFTASIVSGNLTESLFGDFNGDGLDDVFVAYYTQTGSYPKKYSDYKVFLRNSNGNSFSATPSASGTFPATAYWDGSGSGTVCSLYVELYVTDVDGNGKKDITIVKRGKLVLAGAPRLFGAYVLSGNSTATTFTLQDYSTSMSSVFGDINTANYFLVGDFDGDNRTDWITTSGADDNVYLHFPSLSTYNKLISNTSTYFEDKLGCLLLSSTLVKVNDFNGDGKDEISLNGLCYTNLFQDTEGSVYTLNYDGASEYYPILLRDNNNIPFRVTKYSGDFNGDSKVDYYTAESGNTIRYSTGRNQTIYILNNTITLAEPIDTQKIRLGTELFLTGDYNGDGKSDILHYYLAGTTHNMAVYYSNGISFKRELSTFSFPTTYRPSSVGDFNGDGRDDIIDTIAGSTGELYIVYLKPKDQEFLLTKVKDGFERLTQFEYKLHTEPSGIYTYTNPTTNTYPLNTIVPKTYGVYKMTTPDGTGVMSNTTFTEYSYADATTHALKGFLGFKTFKAKDNLSTVVSEQSNDIINNNTSFYLFGTINSKSYYSTTPGTLLSEQIPTYVIDDLTNKRYLLKNTKNISKDYLTDIEQENNITQNTDGNVTMIEQKTKALASATLKQTTTTSINAFIAVSPSAIPSLPDVVTATNVYNGNTYSTVTDNNYTNGLLSSVVSFSGTLKAITTTYEYDGGANTTGLLTKQTITPSITGGYGGYQGARYTRYEYFDNKRTLKKTFTMGTAGELMTQEVLSYDKRFNIPTSVKDGIYTNFVTTNTIDAFGRVTAVAQQPNTINSTTVYAFDNAVANGIYKVTSTSTATANTPQTTQTSIAYYDRLGRAIKTTADNFSGTTDATTTYDAFGRVAVTTAPDASNAGVSMSVTNNYFPTSANHFRLNNMVNSVTGTTQYTYNTATNGENKVKVTAPSGEYKEQTTDATGRLIKSTDATGAASAIVYEYNAQGNTTKITAGSSVTTMEYDAVTGAQTKLIEPNCGTMEYTYNGFGELIHQKDQKTFQYAMEYDIVGRIAKKTRKAYSAIPNTFPATASDEITTYEYETAVNGKEKLKYVKVNNNTVQTYAYDLFHRTNSMSEVVDATNTFTTSMVYNSDNSIQSISYPLGVTFNYYYTTKGFLESVKNGTLEIFKQTGATKYNAPRTYQLNNGAILGNIDYNAAGNPVRYYVAKATTPAVFNVQDLNMSYNLGTGNLLTRTDKTKGTSPNWQNETFTYDNAFDRLKTITTYGGSGTQTMQYDDAKNGNITTKPDAGTYGYDATKLHAVTNITYTCAGTIENYKESQTINYTPFNKAATLQQTDDVNGTPATGGTSTHLITYTYGTDEERTISEYKKDGVTQTKRYYQGAYEKLETYTGGTLSNTKHIYYISGINGLCAIATKVNAVSSLTYNYVFTDHLGSILKLTDNTGTTVAEQSFDAWGRMRNPGNWASYTVPTTYNTVLGTSGGAGWLTRGYTGHEHTPQVDLINMNGRMYDAVLGRMLSPDKYVQDATNSQSYNRYSYVLNNPLKYTDPSGMIIEDPNKPIAGPSGFEGGGMGGGSGTGWDPTMGFTSMFNMVGNAYGTLAAMGAYTSGFSAGYGMGFGSAFIGRGFHTASYFSKS